MSVAVRLDSWREQRLAEEKMSAAKELEKEEEARLKEEDRMLVKAYQTDLKLSELEDRLKGGMVL